MSDDTRSEPPLEHVVPLAIPATPLPAAAEVVVVGGGIMGASIAFHLAEAGVTDVVVLERDTLGSGSSAKPLGGVRATFSDPNNVELGLRSLPAYETFADRFGIDIGLRQVGYLFLCRTEAELAAVEASVRLQNRLGGSSRMLTPAEAGEINPMLDPGALLGASLSPRDGYAEPARVVEGYARAAGRLGVRCCEHTEVLELATDATGAHQVRTQRGVHHRRHGGHRRRRLVDQARRDARRAPARPGHPPAGRLHPAAGPARIRTVPFTLDLSTTLYFHNYRNGLLLGISNPDEDPGFCREFSYGWTRAFDAAAAVVAPVAGRAAARRRLGRPVREHPRPQRHDRQGGGAGRAVRHRLLGPRLPAGAGRRRDRPGSLPGPRPVPGPDGVQRGPVRHRRAAHRGPHHLSPSLTAERQASSCPPP